MFRTHKDTPLEESKDTAIAEDVEHNGSDRSTSVIQEKSFGVVRIEEISKILTTTTKIILFVSIFFVGYAYGLDAFLRGVYTTIATASFDNHSLLSTVNVLRTVFAAAAQPTCAKLADAFGRVEIICLSVVFYIVGTIVQATATDLPAFAAGAVLYTLGLTIVQVLVNVVIADTTSTRARLLAIYVPNLHFIVTAWISGNISSTVLKNTTWQWGIGMWAIIFTVCVIPIISTLFFLDRTAKKTSTTRQTVKRSSFKTLFWQLDVPGIFLLIAVLALLLTPLTIAGGFKTQWQTAHVIAPLVIGFLCIPIFVIWEMKAAHPLIPFRYIKDRGVWSALAIAMTINFTYSMQSEYLFTVLVVAFNFSIAAATRIVLLYLFVSFVMGPIAGAAAYGVRRLKFFVVAGAALFFIAFGLLVHYRGGPSGSSRSGIIAAQVILGLGGGLLAYPALASLQVSLPHEQIGVMTGVFLASHSIGDALGNCVAGAIWTQVLPRTLASNLAFQSNSTLSAATYGNPFGIAAQYPVGTEVRTALVTSYQHIQRLLCITGLCLCVPLLGLAFCLRNPKLSRAQNEVENKVLNNSEVDTETGLITITNT